MIFLSTTSTSSFGSGKFAPLLEKPAQVGRRLAICAGSAAIAVTLVPLDVLAETSRELADLSLEELARLEVSSVAKHKQSLADAPASVYVITEEAVRRSGYLTLPETLRLAPNLQVARVNARDYAISARGFNSRFSNKLLVLIDGRTVYSPLFSGVFWDAQDVMLEDLERIEVISGPGATLWGANAVNGVINISSRPAAETQGSLASIGAGKDLRVGSLRFGGALTNGGHYRVYGKYAGHDGLVQTSDGATADGWSRRQAGFRADWGDDAEGVTLQGDAYTGELEAEAGNIDIAGANLLGRLNKQLPGDSNVTAQAYFDHNQRRWPGVLTQHLNTVDVELQHAVPLNARNTIVWGGGYRYSTDRVRSDEYLDFTPNDKSMSWANLFVQDEITLQEQLKLTLGYKTEHNIYTGWESLPSIRMAWTPTESQLLWGAVSRAVRSPSRLERDVLVPANPPVVEGVPQYSLTGNDDYTSEIARVAELGYRSQSRPTLTWSLTVFFAEYENLRTLEDAPHVSGYEFYNRAEGDVYGLEMWGSWQATSAWRLSAGMVAQELNVEESSSVGDIIGQTGLAISDPSYYGMLRSSYKLTQNIELESIIRHTDDLSRADISDYTSVDLRFGWQLAPELELSLVARNLLKDTHREFGPADVQGEFSRVIFGKLLWEF